MDRFSFYISSQFRNPHGIVGKIITYIQNVVNKQMYSATAEMVETTTDDKVLDIGYGNGHLIQMLYEKCHSDMYGIDISDDAMAMAMEKNCAAQSDGKLHLEVGDCCEMPYESDSFAAITSINTIYFWPDTIIGLAEVKRCLKEGGKFINVVYTREYLDTIRYTEVGYKKYDQNDLVEMGEEVGFSNVEVREISKGKSFAVIYTK